MKPFKTLFLALIVAVSMPLLNSCTTYHYGFINTNDGDVYQNRDRDFVKEEENVSVSYCFFGRDLSVQITVENRTDQPVFINWNESALIVEDAAQSYSNRKIVTTGQVVSTTYHYRDYFYPQGRVTESYSDFIGETVLPEENTFIPPHSKVTKTPLTLRDLRLHKMLKKLFRKQTYAASNGRDITVQTADFTERDTPLRFKSYLTFYTKNNRGRQASTWSNVQSFYISELIRGGSMNPKRMEAFARQQGDFFFTSRTQHLGLAATLAVVGGIAVVWIVTEAMMPDMDMPDMPDMPHL